MIKYILFVVIYIFEVVDYFKLMVVFYFYQLDFKHFDLKL